MTKKFLKLLTIYGRGVHLGHATMGIYTNFRSQFRRRRLKFGFDWQSGFRDDLWKRWMHEWTPSRWVYYKLTISSPCEPNGSDELKIA